jgi:excisionase family DNA binding protein
MLRLMTATEVAEQLRITKPTVVKLIENKQLRGIRVGGQYRITAASFEKFIRDLNEKE